MGPVSDFEQFTLCVSSGGRNVTAFISVHSTHAGARNAMIKKKKPGIMLVDCFH